MGGHYKGIEPTLPGIRDVWMVIVVGVAGDGTKNKLHQSELLQHTTCISGVRRLYTEHAIANSPGKKFSLFRHLHKTQHTENTCTARINAKEALYK